jgi:hypothetical protein
VRFRTLALCCAASLVGPTAGARAPGRRHRAAAPLLLSWEVTNDADTRHDVWFLDGQGRPFVFVRAGGRDPLADEARTGALTERDAAALLAASRPLPATIPAAEVERARALLVGAAQSLVWTHRRKDACPAGVTITVRGYLWPGKTASVVPLRETSCGWLVDDNLSPEAQELLAWISRVSGQRPPRLRR